MASLTISLCLEIPRRLDLLRIRLKGRKLNNEKGGFRGPKRKGLELPTLVSLQPQDMEDLFGGVFLSWMFSRCGISPTVFDRQSKKKLLMIFCLKKKVEKEPLECTISFFVNLCFNIFNPSSRQGPNSTHL